MRVAMTERHEMGKITPGETDALRRSKLTVVNKRNVGRTLVDKLNKLIKMVTSRE